MIHFRNQPVVILGLTTELQVQPAAPVEAGMAHASTTGTAGR